MLSDNTACNYEAEQNKYSHSTNLYPEPSNFLQCMFDKNKGLWKGLVLKGHKNRPIVFYCISDNQSGGPFQSLRFLSSMHHKKLANSRNEIVSSRYLEACVYIVLDV